MAASGMTVEKNMGVGWLGKWSYEGGGTGRQKPPPHTPFEVPEGACQSQDHFLGSEQYHSR